MTADAEKNPTGSRSSGAIGPAGMLDGYERFISTLARVPASRVASLGIFIIVLVLCFGLLVLTSNASWAIIVTLIVSVPVAVTGLLIADRATPRHRQALPRWLWPERRSGLPVFRRQLLPALIVGGLVAVAVWLADMRQAESQTPASGASAAIVMGVLAIFQLAYVIACSIAFRDEAPLEDGRSRRIVVAAVSTAVWMLATTIPMIIVVALRSNQLNMLVFAVLAAATLFCLGVMCRGLQAWDTHEAVRHDFAAFAIQSGVVVFIMLLILTGIGLVGSVGVSMPSLVSEVLRTLVYASTILLVPAGWWMLHVIRSVERRRA